LEQEGLIMSFKDDLNKKSAGIFADLAKKKKEAAATSRTEQDDQIFSTAPGKTGDLQDRRWLTNKVDELTRDLEAARTGSQGLEIPLVDLHEVKGRRRKLTDEEYADLRENLRAHEMVTPIVVRPRAKGGYEIVSGHNRVAVYRELGRTTISAVVKNTADDQADLNAFFANLLQTNLSDYEKFLGFKMYQEKFPAIYQGEIAKKTGKSETLISRLMSFAKLPDDALKIIDANPLVLGSTAANDLAILTEKGHHKRVTLAVQKLIAGELDQQQAVKFVTLPEQAKPAIEKPAPIRISAGKATYCDMRRVDRVLRIEFKSPEEASLIEEAVQKVLEKRAAEIVATKK
jgi:ParB family chromosome partitioning protein